MNRPSVLSVLMSFGLVAAACTASPPATIAPATLAPATTGPASPTDIPTATVAPTGAPELLAGAPRVLAWEFADSLPQGSAVTVFALGLPALGMTLVDLGRATIRLDDPTSTIETVAMSGEGSGDVLVSLSLIPANGQSSSDRTFRWRPGAEPRRSPELDSFVAGGLSSPDGRYFVELAYTGTPGVPGAPYTVRSTTAHVLDTQTGVTADYTLDPGPWDPAFADSGLAADWPDATHLLTETCEANASGDALRQCVGKTPSFRTLDVTDGGTVQVAYPTGPRTLSRLRPIATEDGYQFFEAGLGADHAPVLSLKLAPLPMGSSGSQGGSPTEVIVGRDLFVQVEDRIFRVSDPVGRARNGTLTTAPELVRDKVANPETLTSERYAADLSRGAYVILSNGVAILGRPETYPFAFQSFRVSWWRVLGAAVPHG
jgi:hypothetical protein